ncbi:hypothetical protein [Allonocardiopsis opalescens]|uniref:Uncharacterized protein n=1 Tax=Allonocardiopsis opalescens TaxID=1144618 RepID=A0A2T0PQE6_9ACTN|nr:hypothetical protein [Allonocardiopsis opalescens]PRX90936.1 hypothetical protein CLV72_11532 [Allonocardiopsis opalescens]
MSIPPRPGSPAGAVPAPPRPPAPGAEQAAGAGAEALVAEAVDRLAELDDLPVERHTEVFDHVHRALASALESLDPGRPAGRPG